MGVEVGEGVKFVGVIGGGVKLEGANVAVCGVKLMGVEVGTNGMFVYVMVGIGGG